MPRLEGDFLFCWTAMVILLDKKLNTLILKPAIQPDIAAKKPGWRQRIFFSAASLANGDCLASNPAPASPATLFG